jgi:hypothetical protein
MRLLYGRAGRLNTENGTFRPGQVTDGSACTWCELSGHPAGGYCYDTMNKNRSQLETDICGVLHLRGQPETCLPVGCDGSEVCPKEAFARQSVWCYVCGGAPGEG